MGKLNNLANEITKGITGVTHGLLIIGAVTNRVLKNVLIDTKDYIKKLKSLDEDTNRSTSKKSKSKKSNKSSDES